MADDYMPDRRGLLKCMTWAGSAMVWTVAGGIPRSHVMGQAEAAETGFSFAQVSDSHLGFDKPVNTNVTGSTPIVVFAHVPPWVVYHDWGWGIKDGAQPLTYLKRFGSVTVLNGHIHQVMQKVEGHVAFHTARSTAFPQGVPGVAKGPGPAPVPPGELKNFLGTARISLVSTAAPLAIVDTPLVG